MSFADTCARPRLLFGRFIQAHCKRGQSYYKSTIDLNECLWNSNGKFTSSQDKSTVFDSPLDPDSNIHLDGSKVVAELPTKHQKRQHAIYDLDVCLCNKDGELKWVINDGWLDRDGPLTKAAEAIPGVGFIVALIHGRNNNPEHAKRALVLSGKGLFAILFGILVMLLGRFDPASVLPAASTAFLGTIIADLIIETRGRTWIMDSRIASDIPNRTWLGTLVDGLVAGAAIGAGASIAPHAENATSHIVRTVANVPEEIVATEIELLSLEGLIFNVPRIAKEIAKAGTGGAVRASTSTWTSGTRDIPLQGLMLSGPQRSTITPGRYYICNLQTGNLLEFSANESDVPRIHASKAHFQESQQWVIEQGQVGLKIKSPVSGLYLGGSGSLSSGAGSDGAVEFRVQGDHTIGYSFALLDDAKAGVVLGLDDNLSTEGTINLDSDRAVNHQRWLLEEDRDPDVLELHQGPMPANTRFHIHDTETGVSLDIDSSRKPLSGWPFGQTKAAQMWTLEPGLNGYLLKHYPSGLYAGAKPLTKPTKMLILSLGPIGAEFILEGDAQDGYTVSYAPDPNYRLSLGNPNQAASALLEHSAEHPKWNFKVATE
ncbi:hypothetical protein BDV93DRAFT_607027 [Ceratobasidium sp. AG-I]|nr:hypothetical protein BDV93DRAFT_607027 [Ceratobasidium sp. AG-I]